MVWSRVGSVLSSTVLYVACVAVGLIQHYAVVKRWRCANVLLLELTIPIVELAEDNV